MARYIDADELLKHKADHEMISTHLIYNAPTADVVEVVRCKDCKHGNYFIDAHTDNYGTSVKAKVYCRIWQDWVSANGYCFLADKRGEKEDE